MLRHTTLALAALGLLALARPAAAQSPDLRDRIVGPQPFVTAGKTADKITNVIDARTVHAYRICVDPQSDRANVVVCQTREPSNLNPACHVKQQVPLLPGECGDVAGWRIHVEPLEPGGVARGYFHFLGN